MSEGFYTVATLTLRILIVWFLLASIVKCIQWAFRMEPPAPPGRLRLGAGSAVVALIVSFILVNWVDHKYAEQYEYILPDVQPQDLVGAWRMEGRSLILHADGTATGKRLPISRGFDLPLHWRLDKTSGCIVMEDPANDATLAKWPIYTFRRELHIYTRNDEGYERRPYYLGSSWQRHRPSRTQEQVGAAHGDQ